MSRREIGHGIAARLVLMMAALALSSACSPAVKSDSVGKDPVRPGIVNNELDQACADSRVDSDEDGLNDECELVLAQTFAPSVRVASGGCNWDSTVEPERLGGEYLFAVEQRVDSSLIVGYLPAYYRDCGWSGAKCWLPFVHCAGHAGDSEAVFLEVNQPGQGGGWRVVGIFLSAHCFGRSDGDCRWFRGTELEGFEWTGSPQASGPIIWVAEGRQANYPSRRACDRGHSGIDTCDRNEVAYAYPISGSLQNVGSARQPRGGPGGCLSPRAIGSASRLPLVNREECFWNPEARFRGWQSDTAAQGTTPYARYLLEVARFGTGDSRHSSVIPR